MDGEEVVYVTETGLVYHKDPNCTHLDLSIRQVEKVRFPGCAMKVEASIMPVLFVRKKERPAILPLRETDITGPYPAAG
ncbi:hypothetical protein FYJ34_00650 [Clostridiaceae bacterium 68-1-5]|uniref:Uncharacterized protein n=1 Tax=Suipraeoptans intestinalis TaxID=2606628 RepID=A0A6N7UQL8_9FIRM|nr:hypothetical protein [Suipraeoptans intestinalis]MSR92821.1 hypothetical protein [Suipraeoptans intestinalis]